VAYVLVSPFWGAKQVAKHVRVAETSVVWDTPDSLLRDPFRAVSASIKPEVAVLGRRPIPTLPVVDSSAPPVLSAYLGGEPPMAILDSSGSTSYAKVGDVVFGWKVLRVDVSGVVLAKGSRRVVLR
jgi:hypothetical protein